MNSILMLVPIAGILALLFALMLTNKINKVDVGNERMKEISSYIHEGAMAFLTREYKVLVFFVAALFLILGIGINWITAGCFVVGALFSTLAGFFGMQVATKANVEQLMQQKKAE